MMNLRPRLACLRGLQSTRGLISTIEIYNGLGSYVGYAALVGSRRSESYRIDLDYYLYYALGLLELGVGGR